MSEHASTNQNAPGLPVNHARASEQVAELGAPFLQGTIYSALRAQDEAIERLELMVRAQDEALERYEALMQEAGAAASKVMERLSAQAEKDAARWGFLQVHHVSMAQETCARVAEYLGQMQKSALAAALASPVNCHRTIGGVVSDVAERMAARAARATEEPRFLQLVELAAEETRKSEETRRAFLDGISGEVRQNAAPMLEQTRRFGRILSRDLRHLPEFLRNRVLYRIPYRDLPKSRNGLRAFLKNLVEQEIRGTELLPFNPARARTLAACARAEAWLRTKLLGTSKKIERAAVRLLVPVLDVFTHPAGLHGGDGSTIPDELLQWLGFERRGPPASDLQTGALSFTGATAEVAA